MCIKNIYKLSKYSTDFLFCETLTISSSNTAAPNVVAPKLHKSALKRAQIFSFWLLLKLASIPNDYPRPVDVIFCIPLNFWRP